MSGQNLADIQKQAPAFAIALERVGISGLRFPLRLADRTRGIQTVIAEAALAVDLPPHERGTHMSRFVEVLDAWQEELGCQSMRRLLETLRKRLRSDRAWADFRFLYMMRKNAPAGGGSAGMGYKCAVSAELATRLSYTINIEVPVLTVCPCSLAISEQGAHSQRAIVKMTARISRFVWLEEFIEIAECSASAPVFPLLKRADEKFVTEMAFSRPAFVEDVARATAAGLERHQRVESFSVEVESMESIHNHNAFARVESRRIRGDRD